MANLNFKYYEKDIEYNINDNKDKMLLYLNKFNDNDEKTITTNESIDNSDIDPDIFLAFSNIRENILNWYDFRNESNLLQLGDNYGSITKLLCKKCKSVTNVPLNKFSAEFIYKRHKNIKNLDIICGNIKNIQFDKKFEYIVITDIVEYADVLFGGLEKLLRIVSELLTEDGTIIFAIDNKYGVRNISGIRNNDNHKFFGSILNTNEDSYRLYSKNELEKILAIYNYKFYYPLPDYKLINSIYSDKYIPNEKDTKLSYNIYCKDNDTIILNEICFLRQAVATGDFQTFTNSFLVEISKNITEKGRFIGFNNIRADKFRLLTKICDDKVYKYPINNAALFQITQIKENIQILRDLRFNCIDKAINETIESEFISIQTFDKFLIEVLQKNGKETFLNEITRFFEYLKEKLLKENVETKNLFEIEKKEEFINIDINKLNYIKYGFIDMTFQNMFYEKKEYFAFDQEWLEYNLPIEYILYRSIYILYFHNRALEKILTAEEIYKYFNIDEYIKLFEEMENKWQNNLCNKKILAFYQKSNSKRIDLDYTIETYYKNKEDINYLINKNLLEQEKNEEAEKTIEHLQNRNIELENFLNEESKSFFEKQIKKIKKYFNKKK